MPVHRPVLGRKAGSTWSRVAWSTGEQAGVLHHSDRRGVLGEEHVRGRAGPLGHDLVAHRRVGALPHLHLDPALGGEPLDRSVDEVVVLGAVDGELARVERLGLVAGATAGGEERHCQSGGGHQASDHREASCGSWWVAGSMNRGVVVALRRRRQAEIRAVSLVVTAQAARPSPRLRARLTQAGRWPGRPRSGSGRCSRDAPARADMTGTTSRGTGRCVPTRRGAGLRRWWPRAPGRP